MPRPKKVAKKTVNKRRTVKKAEPKRKRKEKEGIEMEINLKLSFPEHFLVTGLHTEPEALKLKGFIEICLILAEINYKFEIYKISPLTDGTWYFHRKDDLDIPETIRLYTVESLLAGKYVEMKESHIVHRVEEDWKTLENSIEIAE